MSNELTGANACITAVHRVRELLLDHRVTLQDVGQAVSAANDVLNFYRNRGGNCEVGIEFYVGRPMLAVRCANEHALPAWTIAAEADVLYYAGRLVKHRYLSPLEYERINARVGFPTVRPVP